MRPRMIGLALLILTGLAARSAWAGATQITGGFNAQDRALKWQITNSGKSPIVRIEIPHYHIDSVEMPDGWESHCTNLVVEVVPTEPGVCTFTIARPGGGIPSGGKRTFSQHLSLAPFKIGSGSVIVHFADGTSETVPDVELSVVPSRVGLEVAAPVTIALLLMIYAIRRSRKSGNISPPRIQDDVV